MKKQVLFRQGYDKRNEGQGVHGLEIMFVLKNHRGAVTFLVFTNWIPKISTNDIGNDAYKWYEHFYGKTHGNMFVTLMINPLLPPILRSPMPADVGFHSPKPMHEDHDAIEQECPFIDGKPCYYDGSGLNAIRMFEVLMKEGDEGIWRELEDYHRHVFGESKISRWYKKSMNFIYDLFIKYLKFFKVDIKMLGIKDNDESGKDNDNEVESDNKDDKNSGIDIVKRE